MNDDRYLVRLLCHYPFFNVTRLAKKPKHRTNPYGRQDNYCDSGGYQIYQLERNARLKKSKRKYLIIPSVGLRVYKNYLILDPIDICRYYKRYNIKYGITLDLPLSDDLTKGEYESKLNKSYSFARMMFKFRRKICPDTRLFTPLHFSTKNQLYDNFTKMSTLNPDGYAIPVRRTHNWTDMLIIAYTLSFLSHKEIDVVHLLGSSRAEIIVLGAAVMGLNMFRRISFDSTTWKQEIYGGKPMYFSPVTLKKRSFNFNGVRKFVLPRHIVDEIKRQRTVLSRASVKELVWLHNVCAFTNYAKEKLELSQDMDALVGYIKTRNHLKSQRERLLHAIFLLTQSKKRGHEYVEKLFDCIWY